MKPFTPFALLCLTFLASLPARAEEPLVRTDLGPVVGARSHDVNVFKGIPYAAAPLGELRFAATRPHAPWAEPRAAKDYGAKCLQIPMASHDRVPVGSEDCLFLNVWAREGGTNLPVMVFIHGGANVIGSANDVVFGVELYNGEYLAAHGPAVVISFNYRLGALGFLAHPALSAETGHGSGNYGLIDQIEALKWVRRNAAAFGGDPRNVTVFGESAGAIDLLGLLASPLAAGLFDKAIVQSGFLTEQPLAAAEEAGVKLATAVGCDSAACLRAKTGAEILAGAENRGAGKLSGAGSLTIDGHALTAPVLDAYRGGRAMPVPVIIGTNADEMSTLGAAIADTDKIDTEEKYVASARATFGARADTVLARYPISDYGNNPRHTIEALIADLAVHCPARRVSRALAGAGQPVWKYLFSHVGDNALLAPYGAAHAFELPYVFHTLNPLGTTPREGALSEKISRYWLNFAAAGDPNGAGLAPWARADHDETLALDFAFAPGGAYHAVLCDFWDSFR